MDCGNLWFFGGGVGWGGVGFVSAGYGDGDGGGLGLVGWGRGVDR
jgi:hypothetical protein